MTPKQHAIRRETVEIRSLHTPVPNRRQRVPAPLIGSDKQHVHALGPLFDGIWRDGVCRTL
jgi:hypothetical protein